MRGQIFSTFYLEQTIVLSNGDIRMSPRELRQEVEQAGREARQDLGGKPVKSNDIMSLIESELLERLDKFRRGKGKF
jgi:predicted RNA-binding protein with PIN domain